MTRFFYLSLFCHLLLASTLFWIKTPKPPKVFSAKIHFIPQVKTIIPKIKTPKKSVVKRLAKPKIINDSPLKIQNLDLDNLDILDQITKQIVPITDFEQKLEQLALPNLEQAKPNLENLKPQKKPSFDNKESTAELLNTNDPIAENIIKNYRNMLASIIKNNWHNSIQNKNLQTLVRASIQKNGNLLDYTVFKKSNVISFDLSVVNALKISAPFPPFPKDYNKEVEIFYFQFHGGGSLISQ